MDREGEQQSYGFAVGRQWPHLRKKQKKEKRFALGTSEEETKEGEEICINEQLRDDELRAVLVKLETDKDKEVLGLVCKKWLYLQSTKRKKFCARADPHMLRKIVARFTRLKDLNLSQSALRRFRSIRHRHWLHRLMTTQTSKLQRYYGAVSCFVAKLLTIKYMDLVEQSLQALKNISQEHPTACLRAVALPTAANICKKLPSDAADFVIEAVPLLTNLLQYHDAKAFAASPDKLDELCNHGLVTQAASLISTSSSGGGQTSLSPSTYTSTDGDELYIGVSEDVEINSLPDLQNQINFSEFVGKHIGEKEGIILEGGDGKKVQNYRMQIQSDMRTNERGGMPN
ncbi:hypothetical protein L2E82_11339 [Cichorium intybus]|uniref:Uncharacterized protein n=1 Tax=Cichorium intybus TaxID=13427 RepID=A0ACB9GCV2_CICIN|nr:hypothetical protein L2E82_11339 [Cichorium intybus]